MLVAVSRHNGFYKLHSKSHSVMSITSSKVNVIVDLTYLTFM